MAFSDFKAIPEVQEKFGIRHIENDFIVLETFCEERHRFLALEKI